MPRSRRFLDDSESDSDDYDRGITLVRTAPQRRPHRDSGRGRDEIINDINLNNFLNIPNAGGRLRSSSTGARAQPNVINIVNDVERSPSRERRRPSRSRRSSSSSSERYHRHRRHSGESEREYQFRKMMDRLKMQEEKETDAERKKRLLADIKREEAEERERKEKILADAKIEEEIKKRKAQEEKDKAIADWKRDEADKKQKKKEEEAEVEKRAEEIFRQQYRAQGYSEESIDKMLERMKEKKDGQHCHSTAVATIESSRPTYFKVHRKYLAPATLDEFDIPWEWESRDHEFIIIQRYISSEYLEELFAHTKRYHSQKLIVGAPVVRERIDTLRPNDGIGRDGDGLYVVRRKSVSGRQRSRSRGAGVLRFLAS